MGEKLTEIFLLLFCEKNSDGTKNLRLKGKDLYQRIGKRINDVDMIQISAFLKQHPEVINLNLCYNDIGDNGLIILCRHYLDDDNTLQHLNIMNCNITGNGVERLYFVKETLKLKTLRINGNKIGREGGCFLALLLSNCPTLAYLDVGDTDQTVDGVNYILSKARTCPLEILDVSRTIPDNAMYQYDPGDLADNLAIFLQINDTLVELHAQKCQLDGHDVELLVIGLKRNTSLKLLDLANNRIGDFGIELIAMWLKRRPTLLALIVGGNAIQNTGARALSFLMPFSKLRLLDVSYNRITDAGITDLLNSIKKPYLLRFFYFWGNKFTHKTNKIIERMLLSGVLVQEYIDVKLYTVDEVIYAAYYPADHYKHRYYAVMDHGCPVELKIKRNKIEPEGAKPKALVRFQHVDRFPPMPPVLKKVIKSSKKAPTI